MLNRVGRYNISILCIAFIQRNPANSSKVTEKRERKVIFYYSQKW